MWSIWLYVIITSCANFTVNLHSTIAWMSRSSLTSLAKLLSVHLQTKWLWVRIRLLSLKLQTTRLFPARSSLTFRQLYSADFTMNCIQDMTLTYGQILYCLKWQLARKNVCFTLFHGFKYK